MARTQVRATDGARDPKRGDHLTREDRARLLRYMLLMRVSEERALTLYKQGKVPGSFYDGCGQEAISVGAAYVLGPRDRMCILHRDLGAHFVRGVTPDRYLANYMGRAGGVTGGKDGNMHFGDRNLGCVGMVSMLPDMAQVATGLALAFKMRREPRVAMTFFGEGSTANGQWHEAMNFAGIHQSPGCVRAREQPVRVLDAAIARVRGRSRRARRGIRLSRRVGGRERRRGGLRGGARRGRESARRRGPDPDRVPHDAHARPRCARRHELRAEGAARGVARTRPDRPLRVAAGRQARLHRAGDRRDPPGGGRRGRVERPQGARLPDAGWGARDAGRVRRVVGAARRRPGAVVVLAAGRIPGQRLGQRRGEARWRHDSGGRNRVRHFGAAR